MPVEFLDHFTIRCADMERTRAFYCNVLGLTVGPRPAVSVPGYWLYCNNLPQIHLVARDPQNTSAPSSNGAFDHVAFRVSDPDDMIERLKAGDVSYTKRNIPDIEVSQIVVRDPDGILVELNCRAEETSLPG